MSVTRQAIHNLVDVIDSSEMDLLYQLVLKFIPNDEPLLDEINAFKASDKRIKENGTIRDEDIDWDNLDRLDLD